MTESQLIVLATPVFFALIGIELAVGVARGRNGYRLSDALSSIGLGVQNMSRTYQTTMLAVTTFARAAAMTTSFVPAFPFVSLGDGNLPAWAADEVRRHDWRMIIEAGHSISTYYAPWIRDVDVPSSIVCTTDDHGVPPSLQLAAADAIRNATVHRVADGHLACAGPRFAQPLVTACRDVAARVR